MRITSASLSNYSYSKSGSFIVQDDTATINVPLTEDECDQIFATLQNIFFARQDSIAKSISDMKPLVITGPSIEGEILADDGVPF
jgi:hypothetical protein